MGQCVIPLFGTVLYVIINVTLASHTKVSAGTLIRYSHTDACALQENPSGPRIKI
jgi:hypothetical protein